MGNKSSNSSSSNQNQRTSFSSSQNQDTSTISSITKSSDFIEDNINEDAQNIQSKSSLEIDINTILKCSISSKNNYIKLSSTESQKIPVLITVSTKDDSEKAVKALDEYRPPIDLICVIDRSGSMSGEKIKLVRETLKYLVSILSPNDRLCLITFDDQADMLTGLQRVKDGNIQTFDSKIDTITHRGGTNMMLGLNKALELIKNRKYRNKVTSLFMLSDGLDNIGQVDINFKNSLEKLQIQDIFTVNTFGYGNDHDPELMRKLATIKDGNFFYIEKLDLVDEYFVNALGGLLSVIGEKLNLKASTVNKPPFSDLRISKVFGPQWQYHENEKYYSFIMNQLLLGLSKELMLELNIPPIKKKIEDLDRNAVLLKVEIEVVAIKDKSIVKKELELAYTLYNENEEIPEEVKKINQDVMMNYMRVQGAEVIQNARKLADEGKYEMSKKLINENLTELQKEEYKSDEKLKVLSSDLKEIEKLCDPEQYEIRGKKFMMQQEMFHVEQKCTNLSSMAYEDLNCNFKQKTMLNALRSKKK